MDSFDVGIKPNIFYEYLATLKNEVYVILGNHDFSKNRCFGNVLRHFSNNIHIVEEYSHVDINNYRLHFYNYFKKLDVNFELDNSKINCLFTHSDLNVYEPFPKFKEMNFVCSGHIHDFQKNLHYVQLGAVRQCKVNESVNKKYMVMDLNNPELNYSFVDFESVIDIKQVVTSQLNEVEINKNTILRVLLTGIQNQDDIFKIVKTLDWYDSDKVMVEFNKFIDKEFISTLMEEISESGNIDLVKLFEKYLDSYIEKFGEGDISKKELIELFLKMYNEEFEKFKSLFSLYNISFESLEMKNFKLFKHLLLNFKDFDKLTAVIGKNFDELQKDQSPSSNEAGKSNIRSAIEYAILGSDSKVKPLRRKEKSGFVKLKLIINNDAIEILRTFSNSVNDVEIKINNVDFKPNETPTNKMSMFFELYNIQQAIPFILISDTGLAKYFFSSKDTEKFKLFRDIFPIIEYIGNFMSRIKDIVKEKKELFERIDLDKKYIIEKRKDKSDYYWNNIYKNSNDLENINANIIEINNNIECIIINEEVLRKENDILFINKQLTADLLKFNNIYNKYSSLKSTFEEYDKIQENIRKKELLEQKENSYKEQHLVISKKLESLEKENNDLINFNDIKKYSDEELNKDLNKIKDNIIFSNSCEETIKKYKDIDLNKVFDTSVEMNYNNVKKQMDILFNQLKNYKDEYQSILDEIEEVQNGKNVIECPNCKTKIIDKDRLNSLLHKKDIVKEKGSEVNKKYNELNIKLIELKKDNFEELKLIRTQLSNIYGNKIVLFQQYLNDKNIFKEEYSLNVIDEMIKVKDIWLKNKVKIEWNGKEIEKLTTEKILLLKEIDKVQALVINYLDRIDKNKLDKYNDIFNDLKENNITKQEYIINEQKIKDILDRNILNNIDEESIKMFNEVYYKELFIQKQLKEKLNNLKINLEYEIKKRYELELEYNKLIEKLKIDRKEYNLNDINKKLNLNKKDYEDYETLHKVLTSKRNFNYEKYFINHFFTKMGNIFNAFLKVLFDREVVLDISESNFTFSDGSDKDISFIEFSNGAKTKIEAALIFTLNILFENYGTKSDLLFCDEIFDKGVDFCNLGKIIDVLRQFFIKNKKVFIISHKEIGDMIDNRIIVERKNNTSILVGG
jgi:hypothetical protein